MPRPRRPHLHREVTRHGKTLWYVRKGHGPRVAIKAPYGTPEFDEEYQAAIFGTPIVRRKIATPTDSLEWLIERYKETTAWNNLAEATQDQRDNIFKNLIKDNGDIPFGAITKQKIAEGRDKRHKTPSQADNFLKSMRGLFRWATESGHVAEDPTIGIKSSAPKTAGFHSWTDDEIAAFEARWPIGTRERLALALFLFTGLRRGDVARLGRQHVKDGVVTIRTEKNNTMVVLPILPELAEVIDATKTGDLAFIADAKGAPLTKESLGNWFRKACLAAGVKNGRAHGLRKAGATRAAENGASTEQLKAIFGWEDDAMPALYTKAANRVKMARDAAKTLSRKPAIKVREAREKD